MKLVDRYIRRMSAEVNAPSSVRLFTIAAYSMMLINAMYFFPIRDLIWGPYSIGITSHPEQSVSMNFAYILDHVRQFAIPAFYLYVLAIIASLFGWLKWLPRVLVFLLGWMLYYAFIPAFNSSFILYQLFAFYLIPANSKASTVLGITLTNFAMLASKIQFIMVYALAGMFKLSGKTWLEGSSVYYALHLDHFTNPWIRDLLVGNKWLMYVANFFGLTYQLCFPLLIWFRKAKIPLFIAGILFHGFIAVSMRLPEFGLAMILGYTLYFTEELSQKVLWKLRLLKKGP